ncbi:MAG: hypothetical protein H7837_09760 [Magnetococcus sp. MYC-9]
MHVRQSVINSVAGQKAAYWAVVSLREWFQDWEAANVGKPPREQSERSISRFIGHAWWKGDPLPSSLNWNQDILTLGEFLCVAVKTLISGDGAASDEDGGLLLWLLDGVVDAARKWDIASGSEGFNEAISMAEWMGRFFQERSLKVLSKKVDEIKEGLVEAFSRCAPDLTDPQTLHAYAECLEEMNRLFLSIGYSTSREPILERLEEVAEVLDNASRRAGTLKLEVERQLVKQCNNWLKRLKCPRPIPTGIVIGNSRWIKQNLERMANRDPGHDLFKIARGAGVVRGR